MMLYPKSLYYFEQTLDRNRNYYKNYYGNYRLIDKNGKTIPELEYLVTRGANKDHNIIRLGEMPKKKGELKLTCKIMKELHPEINIKKSDHISKLIGTITENPLESIYYGDIQFVNSPIIVKLESNTRSKIRILTIAVFEGSEDRSRDIFFKVLNGSASLTTPDNKLDFLNKKCSYSGEVYDR